jgi:hypothetical protein
MTLSANAGDGGVRLSNTPQCRGFGWSPFAASCSGRLVLQSARLRTAGLSTASRFSEVGCDVQARRVASWMRLPMSIRDTRGEPAWEGSGWSIFRSE